MNSVTSLFTSRKSIRVLLGSAGIVGGLLMMWPTFTTPETRVAAFIGALTSIGYLFGVDIRAIAAEDVATKSGPVTQTNVNSEVRNTPVVPPPVVEPPAPVAPEVPTMPEIVAATLMELRRLQIIKPALPPTRPVQTTPPAAATPTAE